MYIISGSFSHLYSSRLRGTDRARAEGRRIAPDYGDGSSEVEATGDMMLGSRIGNPSEHRARIETGPLMKATLTDDDPRTEWAR